MSDVVDMIRSAVEKNASSFEASFDNVMSGKMDTALQAHYDSIYSNAPAEVATVDTVHADSDTSAEVENAPAENELQPED